MTDRPPPDRPRPASGGYHGGRPPLALTIAGSDSGGGAGIQADLKTFTALGVYGMSAVTALTAQNTTGVHGVQLVPPEFVAAQLDAVLSDIGADAAKTGMLGTAEIIAVVAAAVRRHGLTNLVVDPVMVAKSGDPLLQPDARETLRRELLPLARVVTPNLHEAEALLGRPVRDPDAMKEAARRLGDLGPQWVVVKGGHLPGPGPAGGGSDAVDVVWDGRHLTELRAARVATRNTHGTGCTFSAAIAAGLAAGLEPLSAIARAKDFVTGAIAHALDLGAGHGPTNHLWGGVPWPTSERNSSSAS